LEVFSTNPKIELKVKRDFFNIKMTPVISQMWRPDIVRRFRKSFRIPTILLANHPINRSATTTRGGEIQIKPLFYFSIFVFIYIFIYLLFSDWSCFLTLQQEDIMPKLSHDCRQSITDTSSVACSLGFQSFADTPST
jgi:hypothetical protein